MTGHDESVLACDFEAQRGRLRLIATRLLGSPDEADDAVQETWVRLSRASGRGETIANLPGWLTTVISRVCIDALRTRSTRPEIPDSEVLVDLGPAAGADHDPAERALLAEAVTPALLAVLDLLSPAERVAFVLHDTFGVPFAEIAGVLDVSAPAARQLASRARRKVRETPSDRGSDTAQARSVVRAFLAAARGGDLDGLLAVLHPQARLTLDPVAAGMGAAPAEGAEQVAAWFDGRAAAARPVLLDGRPGLAWWAEGVLQVVFEIAVDGDRVTALRLTGDPAALVGHEVVALG